MTSSSRPRKACKKIYGVYNGVMLDPKKINFDHIPKKFADGAIGAMTKDSIFVGFTSGGNVDMFATSPRIMKSISQFLDRHIENYEKNFGEIDMTPPPIPSPIQSSDLGDLGGEKLI